MKRKSAPVNLYLISELVEAAKKLTERRGDSLSALVDRLLAKELRAQKRKEAKT